MPSKVQATQLPTFGAFDKFETRMKNRLLSSTKNERDSRAFLKTGDEPASKLNPNKIFNFPKNNFFQQISHLGKLSKLHGKVLCFNPYSLFDVDGNVENSNNFVRAASLKRQTQLAFENDILHLRR